MHMKTSMAFYVVFLSSPITFFLNYESAKKGLQELLRHLVKAVLTFFFFPLLQETTRREK